MFILKYKNLSRNNKLTDSVYRKPKYDSVFANFTCFIPSSYTLLFRCFTLYASLYYVVALKKFMMKLFISNILKK